MENTKMTKKQLKALEESKNNTNLEESKEVFSPKQERRRLKNRTAIAGEATQEIVAQVGKTVMAEIIVQNRTKKAWYAGIHLSLDKSMNLEELPIEPIDLPIDLSIVEHVEVDEQQVEQMKVALPLQLKKEIQDITKEYDIVLSFRGKGPNSFFGAKIPLKLKIKQKEAPKPVVKKPVAAPKKPLEKLVPRHRFM